MGQWYYFAPSGEMKMGWVKDKETWYYMDSTGVMKTGEIEVAGQHYYLEDSGAMKQGWHKKRQMIGISTRQTVHELWVGSRTRINGTS